MFTENYQSGEEHKNSFKAQNSLQTTVGTKIRQEYGTAVKICLDSAVLLGRNPIENLWQEPVLGRVKASLHPLWFSIINNKT